MNERIALIADGRLVIAGTDGKKLLSEPLIDSVKWLEPHEGVEVR